MTPRGICPIDEEGDKYCPCCFLSWGLPNEEAIWTRRLVVLIVIMIVILIVLWI